MMITDRIGLYVHIPFCVSKCNYCDFCSVGGAYEKYIDEYIKALAAEADEYRRAEKIPVETLYFGGGTPSLLTPRHLRMIFEGLGSVFDTSRLSEFTLEANPGTVSEDKLSAYRALGVNRLSIGLQSIHENELKSLGRIHSFSDFIESYKAARRAGFDNISVDLMYGIPQQTPDSFRATLEKIIELSPEHISSYGLILEEGTPFYEERDKLLLPSEDEECDMYYLAADMLAGAGYSHYEISNYAKAGYESRHNLKYWSDSEYIGLGAAAYSYFGGRRYGNVRSLYGYLKGEPRENTEIIDLEGEMTEYAMMNLRLSRGIDLSEYEARFGASFLDGREELISEYERCGLMVKSDFRIALTERGFYLSNTILSELLFGS